MLALIWLHFIADFVFQTDKMAMNKSKSVPWLALHVLVYTLVFSNYGLRFMIINAGAHFVTDFISSRATSALWKRGERHWFFVVIGADQAAHLSVLYLTWQALAKVT